MTRKSAGFAQVIVIIVLLTLLIATIVAVSQRTNLFNKAYEGSNQASNMKRKAIGGGVAALARAGFRQDDTGIQTIYRDYVPHLSSTGQIRNSYGSDSMFVLGIYDADFGPAYNGGLVSNPAVSRDSLPIIRDAGFNTIYKYGGMAANHALLDRIDSFGLKVLASYFPDVNPGFPDIYNKPSFFGYYLFDERPPAGQNWQSIYNTIKATDPNHVVFPVSAYGLNRKSNLIACGDQKHDFRSYSDVFIFDLYTIHRGTTNLEELADKITIARNSACQKKPDGSLKPFMFVYQGMKSSNLVRPSAAQIRGEMYLALVHGATGLWDFIFHAPWEFDSALLNWPYIQDTPNSARPGHASATIGGTSPEVTPDLWQSLTRTNQEIARYQNIYLAVTSNDQYHLYLKKPNSLTSQRPLKSILKDTGQSNTRYLLVVNVDSQPISTAYSFPYSLASVTSLFENRPIPVVSNYFIDNNLLEGYGVRLYQITH